jgi:hypothetical protein
MSRLARWPRPWLGLPLGDLRLVRADLPHEPARLVRGAVELRHGSVDCVDDAEAVARARVPFERALPLHFFVHRRRLALTVKDPAGKGATWLACWPCAGPQTWLAMKASVARASPMSALAPRPAWPPSGPLARDLDAAQLQHLRHRVMRSGT